MTYKEWLPALLGPMAPDVNKFSGYNETVDPSLANEFSTAAFRLGHSMLSPALRATLMPDTPIGGDFFLKFAFFNPAMFRANQFLTDMMIGGLLQQEMQEVDVSIIDDVRNFLFGLPSAAGCLDLASMNIQR